MNISKWVVGAALVFSMTLVFSMNVLANGSLDEQVGYVNGYDVRLRAEGNLDASVITKMSYGSQIEILHKEDDWYKVVHKGDVGYVFDEFVEVGEKAPVIMNGNVEMLDWWSDGKNIMTAGTVLTITDVLTGIQYQVRVIFGTNHADVEPLTAEDTAKMSETRNGKWSWDTRAIWVTLENGRTFAASANGMPHGNFRNTNNNFNGHFCIHFLNSYNHGRNYVNQEHQKQVNIAFDAAS